MLTAMKTQRLVRKAVIPIAGQGKRMGPLCRAIPKAMFPLADRRGRALPILHHICIAASEAGIDEVALVVSPRDVDLCHRYFAAAREQFSAELPVNIDFFSQPAPRGLADAVLQAENFMAGQPFMLLLGDHLLIAAAHSRPAAAQVADAYEAHRGCAMIGMQVVDAQRLATVGAARGDPIDESVYLCRDLIEKPDVAAARQRLVTPSLPRDRYLAHGGVYLFTPEIFDCIRELSTAYRRPGEEMELTAAQCLLLRRHPNDYHLVRLAAEVIDVGSPAGYAQAQRLFLEDRK
jgi:UTP--glucose-1-phosphate uridylyltransferase